MKKVLLLICSVGFIFSCGSQKTDNANQTSGNEVQTPVDITKYGETITSADLKEDLYIFALDEFEGRGTGEAGEVKAINFLKDHYVALDVPAAKSNNDYFQDVLLVKSAAPEISLVVNKKSFTMVDDFVLVISVLNGILNIFEIVYVGYGIHDEVYSSYKDLDVKGKVVLICFGELKDVNGNYLIIGISEVLKWSNFRQVFREKCDVV